MSDRAAVIDLGNTISEALSRRVLAMQQWLRQNAFPGLRDLVPAYSSLTVLYDPMAVSGQFPVREEGQTVFDMVKQKLEDAWRHASDNAVAGGRDILLPVCYDPVFGPDLEEMASQKKMSAQELIQLHCGMPYRVYMLGFLPGFAYMGTVDERLIMPRRTRPRGVLAGSVGIAGWQTGIYPFDSPGGWQIIGRTPVRLFNPENDPPALLAAGDVVRFCPISIEEFRSLSQ